MTDKISRLARCLWIDGGGAMAIEYGLIVSFIVLIILTAISFVGTDLSNLFNRVANTV